ncbi:MAG: redoxin domain-containing protein [Alphaproteobacteria bacterium]|uniref:Redoxin domain-containing protein n=1 Tax=Candidatus Nitrobium versatile TaxID=2884831 RepID=A0A953SHX6_9BACT|nr:redoxin domain-containing protein [Candidatus Nitrobium versatile]
MRRILALTLIIVLSVTCIGSAQAMLQVGSAPPEFVLSDLDGKEVQLSTYSSRSKAVVVVFWSTWSASSAKALRRFEEFHQKYKDKGIQVLGINAENQTMSPADRENIRKVVQEIRITFPILLDRELSTFHDYQVIALPSTVIVTDGKISYELPGLPLVGTEEMFDFLRVLAGETPRQKREPGYVPRHDAIADASLAGQFAGKKQLAMARSLYRKAIEKDPQYVLPYIKLAEILEKEGTLTEMEEVLRKALTVDPGSIAAMSSLGYCLAKREKQKEALGLLEKAVAGDESYTPAQYYYAYALGKDGRIKEAEGAFQRAAGLNPHEPLLYLLRAEIREKAGMPAEAAADYRKALELKLRIQR